MVDFDKSELDELTEEERALALKILGEFSESGGESSETYQSLLYDDFKEIPVDIETFVRDKNYLGKAWEDENTGKLKLYDYWLDRLKEMFPDNITTKYNNAIFTGARGIGKSEVSVLCICYLLHRVLCMKNPLKYFHLKATDTIAFAFMNITKDLSEKIGIEKFQNTIQMSPWFLSHGTLTQRDNVPYWNPPKYISIIIGSQPSHVIGQAIYACLDGDTEVITDSGVFPIRNLENKVINMMSVSDNGDIVPSDNCTVKVSSESTDEYQIELDDGSIIKCTPSHKLMLADGSYKEAKFLTEDDELFEFNERFGYIYKFTMIPTNKIYVGKHEKSTFDESYYGSGRDWRKDLDLYGKENVRREILCWGSSRKDLYEKEIYWIDKLDSTNPLVGYNVHKGGAGGNSLNDTEKWSELHRGSRNGRYGKVVSQRTRDLIGKANSGKKRSQEVKDRISKSLKGKKKPDGFGEKVSRFQKGRKRSEIELEHYREGHKITEQKNRGRHIYNNGIVEIRLHDSDTVPEGFTRGRLSRIFKNINNLPRNYRWYNNGSIELYTDKMPENFVHGRLRKSENKINQTY